MKDLKDKWPAECISRANVNQQKTLLAVCGLRAKHDGVSPKRACKTLARSFKKEGTPACEKLAAEALEKEMRVDCEKGSGTNCYELGKLLYQFGRIDEAKKQWKNACTHGYDRGCKIGEMPIRPGMKIGSY
ncbi:MAG: hypothetical protein ACQEXJ_12870 [Myxococcota bacterium]